MTRSTPILESHVESRTNSPLHNWLSFRSPRSDVTWVKSCQRLTNDPLVFQFTPSGTRMMAIKPMFSLQLGMGRTMILLWCWCEVLGFCQRENNRDLGDGQVIYRKVLQNTGWSPGKVRMYIESIHWRCLFISVAITTMEWRWRSAQDFGKKFAWKSDCHPFDGTSSSRDNLDDQCPYERFHVGLIS